MPVECPHILFNNSTFLSEFYLQKIFEFCEFMQKNICKQYIFFQRNLLFENYAENLRILCMDIYTEMNVRKKKTTHF